jgi:hypothetical protein
MNIRMVTTSASLDDGAEMAKFLSGIPNGEQLGEILQGRKPLSSRAYEDETQTARFVECDGHTVTCFTVTDITIDQAEMIAAECVGLDPLNEAAFHQAVKQALHDSLNRAQ